MEVISTGEYPWNELSNFADHLFVLDNIQINSMEGFLQSLKYKSPAMQSEICKLVGYEAKKKGYTDDWKRNQTLYWQGRAIDRHSHAYQSLLDKAYNAMYDQSSSFRRALIDSGDAVYTHKIGSTNPYDTILTISEFLTRLNMCRDRLQEKLF